MVKTFLIFQNLLMMAVFTLDALQHRHTPPIDWSLRHLHGLLHQQPHHADCVRGVLPCHFTTLQGRWYLHLTWVVTLLFHHKSFTLHTTPWRVDPCLPARQVQFVITVPSLQLLVNWYWLFAYTVVIKRGNHIHVVPRMLLQRCVGRWPDALTRRSIARYLYPIPMV